MLSALTDDVYGTGQAPPRRSGGNVSPTEVLKDEARLGAALLNYGAVVCKIIVWLFSPALSFERVVLCNQMCGRSSRFLREVVVKQEKKLGFSV